MAKIKVLFCIDVMNMTGATASLVALLRKLDYAKYDVSLFRFATGNAYLDKIPSEVHQLPLVKDYVMYAQDLGMAVRTGLRQGWLWLMVKRLVLSVGSKLFRSLDKLALAKQGPKLAGEYDIAIAFCCSYMWEFICTKVNAHRRVAWLDTDHRQIAGTWNMFARPKEWDQIVCVSQGECERLIADYPELSSKATVVHNIIDKQALLKKAEAYIPNIARQRMTLVTVGRIDEQKGQNFIIQVALELKRRGVDFAWYLIGPGEHIWQQYLAEAGNPDLADNVFYLGAMENPYPYMKACNLYVQPSRWEGWGMTVTESIACGAPVLVSDLRSFREQVADGVNGWILPLEVNLFCDKIENFAAGRVHLARQGQWLSDYSSAKDFDELCAELSK